MIAISFCFIHFIVYGNEKINRNGTGRGKKMGKKSVAICKDEKELFDITLVGFSPCISCFSFFFLFFILLSLAIISLFLV